ncbi:MAG: DUF1800 family protein [Luteolibacter sp.]
MDRVIVCFAVVSLSLLGSTLAAPFAAVWQLGSDDSALEPFSQETFSPNNPPGSATLRDDDYYLAGIYPPPVNTLTANENIAFMERAVTAGDPRVRIHFPLTAAQASATSRLRVTVDFIGGGAWINGSLPGFSSHDIAITFNGQAVGSQNAITWDRTLSFTIHASSVAASHGANVLQIERTGGAAGGYIGMDYIRLEADPDALADGDGDGIARWFEETYGLNDANPADALLNPDGDDLTNLAEFHSGTNPTDRDTDNDGLSDSREIALGTAPLKSDTDGDGLADGSEINTSPLLADTDNDTYPDNIELEQGTAPNSASSTPFNFPGVISLQFITERMNSAKLSPGEPAGFFRFANWNATAPLPQWVPDGTILTGAMNNLKNQRGTATTAAASWSSHFSGEGLHKGTGDERLLNGLIRTQRTGSVNTPASVSLTGIPYATYDLLVYVGHTYPSARGVLRLDHDAATNRYFVATSHPPFLGWKEITTTSVDSIKPGNFVRYRNLTGASRSLTLQSVDNDSVGIHGIQIINSGTDTDGDGMSDALEIENRFNPSVQDATADADADGMNNAAEIAAGTDPQHRDSDRDGIADGAESTHGTSPLNPDSDGDTLTDGDELNTAFFTSLPTVADSDADGFSDAAERTYDSDPRSATSTPPPVPVWNAGTRTWLWRIDQVRVLWNHEQSMLGAIDSDETMLFEAVADINQSGWNRQIGMGVRYINGKLVHRFRAIEGVFHRSGDTTAGFWNSDWNASAVDRTRALGFSGYGAADDSLPLRLEFSATQPNSGTNLWTLQFRISDLSNPTAPVTLTSYTENTAVAADPSLLSGTTVWKNQSGVVGKITFWNETGIRVAITPNPLGPADSDSDGMQDTWEATYLFNPASLADAAQDPDGDGLSNLREFLAGTHPRDPDSDDDGAPDGTELDRGFDPLSAASLPTWFNFTGKIDDLDDDGLSDSWVLWSGGKNRLPSADDDGDGMSNLAESRAGTDPDDASSCLDLKAWRTGNDFVLSWTDLPDKRWQIESSDALGGWRTATNLPASGIIGGRRQLTLSSEFPAADDSRFYRTGIRPLDTDNDGVEDWAEKNVLGSSPLGASSLGQPLVTSNLQTLGGDAVALLDRLQGSTPAGGTPGSSAPGKPSPVSASRFLMQASFGPTSAAIQQVRDLGFEGWIHHQTTLPPSLLQPYIREIKADGAGPRIDRTYNFNELDRFVFGNNITTPFARNAIAGPDQLRQRVAFALSQILVVSRRDANLEEKPEAITHYYDTLVRHALGNYGDLLRDVTFHPSMGWYLSHAGNQKADPSIPRYPDENYAREIMQLFTIGLWELNPDGSRKLTPAGEPIPTYDNGDVTELARVFTGLYFTSPWGWGSGGWADDHFTLPMVMYPERHDFEAKNLPNGVILPAREASESNATQEVRDAVEALFRHPNTPPFVCRQLIQFLVTDNPSPGYIKRVQDIFVNDGLGVRGNLAAVVKAILLDTEARNPPLSPTFGKVREPVIRTMHLGRLFNLPQAHPKFVWWNWTENFYGPSSQEPMNSPSVFNFYTPVYQAPGEIRNAGLVSPGFQIINTYSAVSFPNLLWDYLHDGFKAAWDHLFPLDYSDTLLLAQNPAALVDHVDLLVCAGSMTAHARSILLTALQDPALSQKDRVALAVWTAMTSPEGVVQK